MIKTQTQLDELTTKTGLIPIDDPSLVYVRPLNRPAPMVFVYQLVIPASTRFKLIIGEGVGKSFDILDSTEISGPRPGFSHPPQRTISVYVRKTAQGWYAGYVNAGGTGAHYLGSKQLDWLEKLDNLQPTWNAPLGIQRKIESYNTDDTIYLLDVNENEQRENRMFGQKPAKIDNPRKFRIWLEPMDAEKS